MRTIDPTTRFKRDYRRELKGWHGRAIDREKPTPPHRGGVTSANRIARHGVKAGAEVARLLRRAGPMSVRRLAGELGRDYKSSTAKWRC